MTCGKLLRTNHMKPEFVMPLVGLGKQARVPHSCMRQAILVWSSQDHFGDDIWWWVTCQRLKTSRLEVKFWIGGWNWEGNGRFEREVMETATADSWVEMRTCLDKWRVEKGFYLPDELLDNGLCWMINEMAPKLRQDCKEQETPNT
jgi:hypothetical protein